MLTNFNYKRTKNRAIPKHSSQKDENFNIKMTTLYENTAE